MKNKIIIKILSVLLGTFSVITFIGCNLGGGDADGDNPASPVSIVGTYTGAWNFLDNGVVTNNPNPYDYSVSAKNGTYIEDDGTATIVWENGEEQTVTYDEKALLVDGKTYNRVDIEKLYQEFAGTYFNYDYKLDGTENFWKNVDRIIFNSGRTFGVGGGNGVFSLVPITENHGLILNTLKAYGANVMGSYVTPGNPLFLAYYVKIDGEYHIRLSNGDNYHESNGTKSRYFMWKVAHNHFIDFTRSGSAFTSDDMYEVFGGSGGTEQNPVSKQYLDGLAKLTILSDGVDKIINTSRREHTDYPFKGGKAKFNDGAKEIDATYSVIKLSATNGKFFIDMSSAPVGYNADKVATGEIDKSRFVVGDYTIDGQNISISFSYEGRAYNFIYQ